MATQVEVPLRVTTGDLVRITDMPVGQYFLGYGTGAYRGVWQRASQEAVTTPNGTYVSIYLGLLDGLANGCDPRYFDSNGMGYPLTNAQALALLAAQS